jgi:CHAT domain-containing protein
VSLERIQTRIVGQDSLLLEYFLGNEAGYVLVISPAGQQPRIEKLLLEQSDALALGVEPGALSAGRMRQVMSNSSGNGLAQLLRQETKTAQAVEKLAVLWRVLIPEAQRAELTGGKLRRLVVIPDSTLALLPFDTLVVERGAHPRYLLDAGPPIVSAPSATLLHNLTAEQPARPASSQTQRVLSVGDAVYSVGGGPSGRRWGEFRSTLKALPFSGLETNWVSEVFQNQGITADTLGKQRAREAVVRENLPGREIIHLACHGLVDQSYGNLFGALAFTPGADAATNSADDGFLTLSEIYQLPLQGTALSILSACDTNFGPEQQGEGVWSLSRGFLVAGSKRVVASNWLVDDEAAATLISLFCSALAKGEKSGTVDYAESLQSAKRWVHAQEKWQSPYYWGTFVLLGPN